jgi:hypothetical protein
MTFGQAVYARRSTLGWCTAELARRSGMSTALKSVARIAPGAHPEFRFEEPTT